MEMKRRGFLRFLVGAGTALAAPLVLILKRQMPARFARASRARAYPGPVKPLDESRVAKPARWAG